MGGADDIQTSSGEALRVLLLYPPSVFAPKALTGTNRPVIFHPLGILGIASCLRDAGHSVSIHDARLSARIHPWREDQCLFGDPIDELVEDLARRPIDVVGISHSFPLDRPVIEAIARGLKQRRPDVTTVLGGHTATTLADTYRTNPHIDFVVRGEGEHKMLAVLRRIGEGGEPAVVDGTDDGLPYFIQDLDSLPLPAYDLVDMERYFHLQAHGHSPRTREYGVRSTSMFTSRGCPWDCGFCSIHPVMGYRFRAHSAGYVVRHMAHLSEQYAIDYLHIEDDNFTLDARRTHAILDGLIDRQLGFFWDTPNGVRADMLSRDLIAKAKRSGCQYLVVGVESGDEVVLNSLILKDLDLRAVRNACRWCQEVGLEVQAFYVFGYPGETLEQMERTARLALALYRRFDVYPNMSIITPLTGTRVWEECEREGYLVEHRGAMRVRTPEFDPGDLDELVLRLRRQVFVIFAAKALGQPRRTARYVRMVLRSPRAAEKLLAGFGRRAARIA